MLREHGHDAAVEVLTNVLVQAQVACGEPDKQETAEIWAAALMSKFDHLSVETFVLAIRDGLTSGKVYGKLNLPQISEWMAATDKRICDVAEGEATVHKFTGDNLGKDYLDRVEHDAGKSARQLDQKDRLIERLREKLDTKQNPAA